MTFSAWRRVHRSASAVVAVMGVAHSTLTFSAYDEWGPDAVWFLGTGLSLLFLAVINWAHVGLSPCSQPTAPVIRYANAVYALFGAAAVLAVPQAHAMLLMSALTLQAIASVRTLPGPAADGG